MSFSWTWIRRIPIVLASTVLVNSYRQGRSFTKIIRSCITPFNMGSLRANWKNIIDEFFVKSSSLHDSIYMLSLSYIYYPESHGCIMQSLSCLLYFENRTGVSGLYMPLHNLDENCTVLCIDTCLLRCLNWRSFCSPNLYLSIYHILHNNQDQAWKKV